MVSRSDERRLAFGSVAELYDELRPSYPSALIDEVLERSHADRALEVGTGTGKATTLFAARGVSIVALEPSSEMAAIARRNCAPFADVEIVLSDFERFDTRGERFPLLFSAQAWHWVSRGARHTKARAAMSKGGVLAAFWNRPNWEHSALREPLRAAYRQAGADGIDGPMNPGGPARRWWRGDWRAEIGAAAGFDQPAVRHYNWPREYSTEQYVGLLQTHSDHIVLEHDRRQALLEAVAAVIDRDGGRLQVSYDVVLCLATAR